MTNHQAIGHMRALMSAQHFLHQAHMQAEKRNPEAARKFIDAAYKEMSSVKEALAKITELTTPTALLRMFYDDLDRQRVEVIEKEVLIAEKAKRLFSKKDSASPRRV